MMLIELAPAPGGALPVQEFRAHLRLGSGFGDDAAQDALLESYLRAALAAIEGRIGKALLSRGFVWRIEAWREAAEQRLPVAPVAAVEELRLLDRAGAGLVVEAARYRLVPDHHRPRIVAAGAVLPAIPPGGAAEIRFTAGFGPAWPDLPVDLAQAVLLLAGQYYETRHETGAGTGAIPFGVMALIERWRTVRVLGGGAA